MNTKKAKSIAPTQKSCMILRLTARTHLAIVTCVPRKWKSIYNTSAGLSYIYYMYALQGCSAVFDLISVVSLSSLGLIGLMSFRFSGLSCSFLSINFFIIFLYMMMVCDFSSFFFQQF